ncbi:preprotein translocase subunit SecA [Candidatus Berkelbacteria bacterium]|nr:preprotein translocase subunit SecA [Candidatus Berkelbacteria bacterium]
MGFFDRLLGTFAGATKSKYQPLVGRINALEPEFEKLSDKELMGKTLEFKQALAEGKKTLDELLPEAFATVREAAKRTIGQRHYDVQLIGGMVLHQGKIAEMRTGEGKTLVATLPLYLNALTGKGVHLITVNDFLAKFHAQWMGPIFDVLGITVAAIGHESSFIFSAADRSSDDPTWKNLWPISRREAYAADITYGTNNEFGFDYLRDNMVYSLEQLVQRPFNYAIIDEIDSILIDEARTPLIISAPAEESASWYQKFAQLMPRLTKDEDYQIDEKQRAATLTDGGIKKIEGYLGIDNLYNANTVGLVHHLEQALRAQTLYHKDKDYVVREGEIVIVDEFTGRLMLGRRYSEGLHQAIEAKERVEVKRESDTLGTISFQNLFRLYPKLSGMTGTAKTEEEEFWRIYRREVMTIPTNRPMIRVDHQDKIYVNEDAKFAAVAADVRDHYDRGQPVLIGTISIEKNEKLSKLLKKAGVKHELLNAKNHEREAKTIAQAGRKQAVTLATNIAGRGVDILLGGTPPGEKSTTQEGMATLGRDRRTMQDWQKEHEEVISLGGLHVVGTERHESRRIDNQLRGRGGRQGDPGSSQFYVSMDDDLMRIFGGERMKSMMERLRLPEDVPIENGLVSKSIEQAQKKVEGHNFDIRKHLLEYDDVLNKHREAIYKKRRLILESKGKNGAGEIVPLHEEIMEILGDERAAYEKKYERHGAQVMSGVEQAVYLRVIDTFWIEHLNLMAELREGIGLRGYAQRDPLVEYKQEAYALYQRLLRSIEDEVANVVSKVEINAQAQAAPAPQPTQVIEQGAQQEASGDVLEESTSPSVQDKPTVPQDASKVEQSTKTATSGVTVTVRKRGEKTSQLANQQSGGLIDQPTGSLTDRFPTAIPKVGRNEPCPCGSGKKFKKCHGA